MLLTETHRAVTHPLALRGMMGNIFFLMPPSLQPQMGHVLQNILLCGELFNLHASIDCCERKVRPRLFPIDDGGIFSLMDFFQPAMWRS